jgi:hypothetical protein
MPFTIDTENNITVFSSFKEIEGSGSGTETFSSAEELAALSRNWPGARLVEIWNSLPGLEAIHRFTSRQVAVRRIWKAIQRLEPTGSVQKPTVTAKKESTKHKPSGASLKAIMRVTGWQAHSVRGFISGQLGKKRRLKVRSFERDGERVYTIKD